MLRPAFRVTYEIVTYESAAFGDSAENGFVDSYGFKDTIEVALASKSNYDMTLRDAVKLVGLCYDAGNWFSECEGNTDYRTGDNETRALHCPANITNSSYRRVAKLVGAKVYYRV